jgi:hypothetical protein
LLEKRSFEQAQTLVSAWRRLNWAAHYDSAAETPLCFRLIRIWKPATAASSLRSRLWITMVPGIILSVRAPGFGIWKNYLPIPTAGHMSIYNRHMKDWDGAIADADRRRVQHQKSAVQSDPKNWLGGFCSIWSDVLL